MAKVYVNLGLVSIFIGFLLICSGHAIDRGKFFSTSDIEAVSNNGPEVNSFPGKLQPSLSCILLGEAGCQGTCTLMGKLYGCDTNSICRKGIYCECNEVYHFQKRDISAENFENLPLNELWYYRFAKTPQSTSLLNQIRNNNEMREYTSSLLRDPHITGEDAKYLLSDEYPSLDVQLQELEINAHGLKSELAINGDLEYDNIGDYLGDLFQSIKDQIGKKLEHCRSKRRVLNLIRNINNEQDLQYILRQILMSGDDKLYNFVSSYLRRNGHMFEDDSLCQPRRRFGCRQNGCRKRKRYGKGRGGNVDIDFNGLNQAGSWHGRPIKKKIILKHNDMPITLDADEDEIIEIALINELKGDIGAEITKYKTPQLEIKKEVIVSPSPQMRPTHLEIPTPAPAQSNLLMHESMAPSSMTYTSQIPTIQKIEEVVSTPKIELPISASAQKDILLPEMKAPILMTNMPEVPSMRESEEMVQTSFTDMKPISEENHILSPSYSDTLREETKSSILETNASPTTIRQQREEEILAPQQTNSLELPLQAPVFPNNIPMQGVTPLTASSTFSPTMGNNLDSIFISDIGQPSTNQFINQVENAKDNLDHLFPEIDISETGYTISDRPVPSPTTIYTNQVHQDLPELISPTINFTPIPQNVYKYVSSSPSMMSFNPTLGNNMPTNKASFTTSQHQNELPNYLSTSTSTNRLNEMGLPQSGYGFQTGNLAGHQNASGMNLMGPPMNTITTISNGISNSMPKPSSNIIYQNDMFPGPIISDESTKISSENLPTVKQSNIIFQSNEFPTSSQIMKTSTMHDDIPRYFEQSATNSLDYGNSNEPKFEYSTNQIQFPTPSGFTSTYSINKGMGEAMDNMNSDRVWQGNSGLGTSKNVESNRSVMQQDMSKSITDEGYNKNSLFYLLIDKYGNVVHSANVDPEKEREKHAAAAASSSYWSAPSYFSQIYQNGMNPLLNYKRPNSNQ